MRDALPNRFLILIVGFFAAACLCAEPAIAQSSSRGRGVQPGSSSQSSGSATTRSSKSPQSYEAKLWDYLARQKYWNWAPAPGQSDEAYPGQSPHGAFLKMYLNRKAAGNPRSLPDGSIIVKENYAADGKTLAAITIMYRTKNYNAEGGDWYWAKFNPDGTVARTPPEQGSKKLAGQPTGCIECHDSSKGDDFAFFNDEL